MNFNEYQDATGNTWDPNVVIKPEHFELCAAAMGLGEAGELLDEIKKVVFHGIPADVTKIKKEIGDAQYYLARIAAYFKITMEDVADTNIAKLAARYPNGFVKGGGIR